MYLLDSISGLDNPGVPGSTALKSKGGVIVADVKGCDDAAHDSAVAVSEIHWCPPSFVIKDKLHRLAWLYPGT